MPLFPSDLFKELHGHFNTNQKGTNDNFVGEHVVPEENINIGNYITAPPLPIDIDRLNSEIYGDEYNIK